MKDVFVLLQEERNERLSKENEELKLMLRVLNNKIDSYESEIKELRSQLDLKKKNESKQLAIMNDSKTLEALKISIFDLPITTRTLNILKYSDCEYLGDVVLHSESDFLKMRFCGKATIKDISRVLKAHGLSFNMDVYPLVSDYIKSIEG